MVVHANNAKTLKLKSLQKCKYYLFRSFLMSANPLPFHPPLEAQIEIHSFQKPFPDEVDPNSKLCKSSFGIFFRASLWVIQGNKSHYFIITPRLGPQTELHSPITRLIHSIWLQKTFTVSKTKSVFKSWRFVNFARTGKVLQALKTIAKEKFHEDLSHSNLWDWKSEKNHFGCGRWPFESILY